MPLYNFALVFPAEYSSLINSLHTDTIATYTPLIFICTYQKIAKRSFPLDHACSYYTHINYLPDNNM